MARCVIAFPMHEYERDAVLNAMTDGATNGSVVVGQLDDAEIEQLRESGVLVQVLDLAEPQPPPPQLGPRYGFALPESAPAGPPPTIHRLRLNGPLLPPFRASLEQLGVEILEGMPGFAVKVRIPPENVAAVNGLGFVAGPAEPLARAAPVSIFEAAHDLPPATVTVVPFDVLLLGPDARQPFLDWLRDKQVTIGAAKGVKVRLYLPEQSPLVGQIGYLREWVACIEQYVPPKLHNDVARRRLGIDCEQQPGVSFPFEGEGQVVAVADTGLDDSHPDFANRIVGLRALGRPPANTSDPIGHGTHVAGSVLGDGSASGGKFRGTAPKARLFFQSLLDKDGGLGGLPLTLDELFEEAYQAGARIHNNSWGTATSSVYRIMSSEVDDFVRRRKDMLIVISAGNEGSAAEPAMGRRNVAAGFVDFKSIGAPATCKNALTVGASRSGRTEGGRAGLTYGAVWPDDFPSPPIADALISADPQAIGAFSSRGPCDYRIKPDVVAPGTDILSCRSSRAPVPNFWGLDPLNPRYAYMGGTSMAAPLVSGCAALVREYYIKTRNHQPSAALIKATLINGTVWLSAQDAVADYPDLPNYHQGFGAVHLPSSIPTPRQPEMVLEFVDNWNDPPRHLVDTGARFKLGVAGGRLRLCLAYTDAPGIGLQNNLDMLIQVPGVLRKRFGNENVPRGFNGPDPTNNVEVITIEDAPPGDYLVHVTATNILKPPQDFALVATGRLTTAFRPD